MIRSGERLIGLEELREHFSGYSVITIVSDLKSKPSAGVYKNALRLHHINLFDVAVGWCSSIHRGVSKGQISLLFPLVPPAPGGDPLSHQSSDGGRDPHLHGSI